MPAVLSRVIQQNQRDRDGQHFWGATNASVSEWWTHENSSHVSLSCIVQVFSSNKNIHAFSITFCLTFCEVSFDARVGPLKDAHFHKRPFVEVIYGRYDMALKLLMFIHDTSRKRRLSQEAHYCESLTLLGLYLKLQLQPKGVFAGIFRGVTV